MLKKTNTFSRLLLIFISSSMILTTFTYNDASATSAYDNVIQPIDKIELYKDGCSNTIDFTSNWEEAFFGANSVLIGWGNGSGSSISKNQASNLFNNKTYWGVSVQDTPGVNNMIVIWWTDATSDVSVNFDMDGSYPRAVAWKNGSGTYAFLGVMLDSNCSTVYISSMNYTTGVGAYPIAYDPSTLSSFGQTIKSWRQFTPFNEPAGYEGLPINKHIEGNVICTWGDTIITGIQIETSNSQDGGSLLSDGGILGTHYDYYLTDPDDTYRINVLCDGEIGMGPTVLTTASSSLNWSCQR